MTLKLEAAPLPLVIWGASGHARVVADIVRITRNFNIVGFMDSVDLSRKGTDFCGAPILGGEEQLEFLHKNEVRHLFLGIGDCQARLSLAATISHFGFELATIIHPRATVSKDVFLGPGTVVMAGAVVNPASTIGENVIVNTSASIDHDCVIENGVHIGPGAHLGGGVTIGQGTWVGIGAIIKDKIRIGKGAIIGAGAVVLKDIPENVIAFGVPAKIIRKREE
jgi:sugar O-acyltransferase (sialic acid O-acetyltransferase NeuD family)